MAVRSLKLMGGSPRFRRAPCWWWWFGIRKRAPARKKGTFFHDYQGGASCPPAPPPRYGHEQTISNCALPSFIEQTGYTKTYNGYECKYITTSFSTGPLWLPTTMVSYYIEWHQTLKLADSSLWYFISNIYWIPLRIVTYTYTHVFPRSPATVLAAKVSAIWSMRYRAKRLDQ